MAEKDTDKKVEKPESSGGGNCRKQPWPRGDVSNATAKREHSHSNPESLMSAVVDRENMVRALHRVERNKGTAGVDNMSVGSLREFLKAQWPKIKEALLKGDYHPQAVLRVEIPKPGGGVRKLGIPTVVDRLIQQALHQTLSSIFEPTFSQSSYGFRPGRSAHMALEAAREYVAQGKRWVVDMDLEKFFDRVNHDILMSRLARRVKDKRILLLIRRYLQSGIMANGIETASVEGTPQGGPLSPLLSNVLLDDLDKELERRGHVYCRYADDCNIYVQSQTAGQRAMACLTRFLERKLKLQVNKTKSAVGRPWERKFLGHSMTWHKRPRLKVAPESLTRLKGNLRALFRKSRGRNLGRVIKEDLSPKLRGWVIYFRLAEVKSPFDELDGWIRRKLRCVIWRQWKRPRTRGRKLMAMGFDRERAWTCAGNGRGAWWNAGAPHMNEAFPAAYFARLGLVSLQNERLRFQKVV